MTALLQQWLLDHLLTGRVTNIEALELLALLPDASVDAIITDPPYAEVGRDYGRFSEAEWMELMQACVIEFRRVLKPRGSVMMVLQPNSEHVGQMRLWLWKFMVWCGEYWNIVQDAYWWNFTQPPTVHTHRDRGLMRPSVKTLVWLGEPDCYRNQDNVLWKMSDAMAAEDKSDRALRHVPSGYSFRRGRVANTTHERGGSTPFNLLPIANANSSSSAGAHGHGAGTPDELFSWWLRYIVPDGGLVVDPFVGSGTLALEARKLGYRFVCGERDAGYAAIAQSRIAKAQEQLTLWAA